MRKRHCRHVQAADSQEDGTGSQRKLRKRGQQHSGTGAAPAGLRTDGQQAPKTQGKRKQQRISKPNGAADSAAGLGQPTSRKGPGSGVDRAGSAPKAAVKAPKQPHAENTGRRRRQQEDALLDNLAGGSELPGPGTKRPRAGTKASDADGLDRMLTKRARQLFGLTGSKGSGRAMSIGAQWLQ